MQKRPNFFEVSQVRQNCATNQKAWEGRKRWIVLQLFHFLALNREAGFLDAKFCDFLSLTRFCGLVYFYSSFTILTVTCTYKYFLLFAVLRERLLLIKKVELSSEGSAFAYFCANLLLLLFTAYSTTNITASWKHHTRRFVWVYLAIKLSRD